MPDLLAVLNAIKKDQQGTLTALEFEAIRAATFQTVAIAKRKLAADLVANAREDFKQQVEALASRIT